MFCFILLPPASVIQYVYFILGNDSYIMAHFIGYKGIYTEVIHNSTWTTVFGLKYKV